MFCTKCGNNIPDGTKFCSSCGAPAPTTETVAKAPETVTETVAPAPKKKSKVGLVIGIIVAILVLAGGGVFGFLFLNNPMRKINKAIEISDTATVVELYDKLSKEEDQELVKEEMLKVADKIYDDYVAGDLEYDDAKDQLKPLGKAILKGDKSYDEIIENIDTIEDSRDNFAKAEKAFDAEDYEGAYSYYMLVDSLDKKNYKAAQDQIIVCESLMVVPIEGTWTTTLDLSEQLMDEMGLYGASYPIVFNVPILLTLEEGGYGYLEIDTDAMDDTIDEFISSLDEVLYVYLEEEEGLSRDDVDMYLALSGYDSINELVKEFADVDELKDSFANASAWFEYTYEDDNLYIVEDDCNITVDVTDDTLTFLGADNSLYNTFNFELFDLDYDYLVFDKVN